MISNTFKVTGKDVFSFLNWKIIHLFKLIYKIYIPLDMLFVQCSIFPYNDDGNAYVKQHK